MAEGTSLTGMPTYPAYGVDPSTTAFPEATTASGPVASSSASAGMRQTITIPYPPWEPLWMFLGMQP